MSIEYNKPWLNLQEQINLLTSRGLIIHDQVIAENALLHTGYYHLSAYFKSLQVQTDTFDGATTLQDVLDVYAFDRRLTLLFFDAIERIEVSLRSVMVHCCGNNDIFWYNNIEMYSNKDDFIKNQIKWKEELERLKTRDGLIAEYNKKYSTEMPPCWIFFEILSFGGLVKIIQNLDRKYRMEIATQYSMPDKVFLSGLRGLVDVRNICAHHERLWNRRCKNRNELYDIGVKNSSIFSYILYIKDLLKVISPTSTWITRMEKLIEKNIQFATKTGLTDNWKALLHS